MLKSEVLLKIFRFLAFGFIFFLKFATETKT